MKKLFTLLFLLVIGGLSLYAQSNTLIDRILAEKNISAENAAYILLAGKGLIVDNTAPAAALESMKEQFPASGIEAESSLTLGQYCLLVQTVYGLPKGLMSSIMPGPRNALKDMKFLNIVQGHGYAKDPVSGERALRILQRALGEVEARK
jgi:hypothetical protein